MRLDGKNAVCLSVMFPNDFLLKRFRNNNPKRQYIILSLSPDILWEKNCEFYNYNAASTSARNMQRQCPTPLNAFNSMFADEVMGGRSGNLNNYVRAESLKPFLPTVSQAEVLVFDIIEPHYISGIICENDNLTEKLKSVFRLKKIKNGTGFSEEKVFYNSSYFGDRNEMAWRNSESSPNIQKPYISRSGDELTLILRRRARIQKPHISRSGDGFLSWLKDLFLSLVKTK